MAKTNAAQEITAATFADGSLKVEGLNDEQAASLLDIVEQFIADEQVDAADAAEDADQRDSN
jgi:hypothetical protein